MVRPASALMGWSYMISIIKFCLLSSTWPFAIWYHTNAQLRAPGMMALCGQLIPAHKLLLPCIQWCNINSLESAVVGVVTPKKSANATNQGFSVFFSENQLIDSSHIWDERYVTHLFSYSSFYFIHGTVKTFIAGYFISHTRSERGCS